MSFDAASHITMISGKEYLEVKWRIVWFREDHPAEEGWGIVTKPLKIDERLTIYRAEVVDPDGRVVATGVKSETPAGFADFIEKAETGSIGRALALLGYGTQWCAEELDEGARIVDSPVVHPPAPPVTPPGIGEDGRPTNLDGLGVVLCAKGIAQEGVPKLSMRAAKWLEITGAPPNWTPENIGAIYDKALDIHKSDLADAEVAKAEKGAAVA